MSQTNLTLSPISHQTRSTNNDSPKSDTDGYDITPQVTDRSAHTYGDDGSLRKSEDEHGHEHEQQHEEEMEVDGDVFVGNEYENNWDQLGSIGAIDRYASTHL